MNIRRFDACLVVIMLAVTVFVMSPAQATAADLTPYQRTYVDDDVSVSVELETTNLLIAQPTTMVIRVDAPTGSTVQFPTFVNQVGDLEVIETERWQAIPIQDRPDSRRWTQQTRIESLRTGDLLTSEFEVRYTLPSGDSQGSVRIDPVKIAVASVLSETESDGISEFREIKGPVETDMPTQSAARGWLWALGVTCIAAMTLTALWRWHRTRKRVPIAIWARREISAIRRRSDRTTGQPSRSYSELIDVLRQYASERFHLDIRSMSTSEMVTALANHDDVSPNQVEQIRPMLVKADQAKFAGVASDADVESSCDLLRDFVADTDTPSKPGGRA